MLSDDRPVCNHTAVKVLSGGFPFRRRVEGYPPFLPLVVLLEDGEGLFALNRPVGGVDIFPVFLIHGTESALECYFPRGFIAAENTDSEFTQSTFCMVGTDFPKIGQAGVSS